MTNAQQQTLTSVENGTGAGGGGDGQTTDTTAKMIRPVKSKQQFYNCFHRFIWIFPLCLTILVPTICLTAYVSAIYYHHLEPLFPFVSDAGAWQPQAAFFSQFLDLVALLHIICVYNRNKQIKFYLDDQKASKCFDEQEEHRIRKFNFLASLFGYLSAFGLLIIGNFRINENIIGHVTGVTFAFPGIAVYEILTYIVTKQMHKCEMESFPTTMTVAMVIGVFGLSGVCVFSFVAICHVGFGRYADTSFRVNWKPDEPGYYFHVLGTAFEWVAINSAGLFYLSLYRRFYLFAQKYYK